MKHEDTALDLLFTPLSPIHIGCGESSMIGEYLFHNGNCHHLNPTSVLDCLDEGDKKRLVQIVEQTTGQSMIKQLQGFYQERAEQLLPASSASFPVPNGIDRYYDKRIGRINQNQVINQLKLERHTHSPLDQLPYIPGSSLKGAIRTAWLQDRLDQNPQAARLLGHRRPQYRYKCDKEVKNLQGNLLEMPNANDVTSDPFSQVAVADMVSQANTRRSVLLSDRLSLKKGELTGIRALREVILPLQPAMAKGQIRLKNRSIDAFPDSKVRQEIPLPALIRSINDFYLPKLREDMALFEGLCSTSPFADKANWLGSMKRLLPLIERGVKTSQLMVVKLGRDGGAVSKTWDNYRQINIPQLKKLLSHPTTLPVACTKEHDRSPAMPFGWAILHGPDNELFDALRKEESDWWSGYDNAQETLQNTLQERQQRLVKEKALKAEQHAKVIAQQKEQARQQQEEVERRAQMSEEDKLIDDLQKAFANEKQIGRIDASGELRTQLTEVIVTIAADGNGEQKQVLTQLAKSICQYWSLNLKKNKKMKTLIGQLS